MKISPFNEGLFQYLESSPTPFHAVHQLEQYFLNNNYIELKEDESWNLKKGQSYFLSRQQGALIAFTLGCNEEETDGFRIITAHSDSPCLQLKPQPDINTKGYKQLGVEVYGGALLAPWFDRNLTLAGRVTCSLDNGSLQVFLVNFKRPLLTIPSIAIHLNREANNASSVNKQKDLPPVTGLLHEDETGSIEELILNYIGVNYSSYEIDCILGFDLFCVDTQGPTLLGCKNEIITAARLDNLLSAYSCSQAMVDAGNSKNTMFYIANHEENGSMSATGAQGNFINSIIERILPDPEDRGRALSNTFLVSVDNAHATHPNATDTMDPAHDIKLNKGVVIKVNANQRYTTNSISNAIYKKLCNEVGIESQEFVMKSDMPCGSTIGPLAAARLGVQAIDIGAPTLGMHSIRELTGSEDPEILYKSLKQFLSSDVHKQLLNI
ncbi:M18 family aminopeptidase [Desulforhopalus sp. 52FAK]